MTLIVSLRIPDGIVLAGDSLATMMGNLQPHVQFDVVCPHCGKPHKVDSDLPPIVLPSTTFPYAQKVIPFLNKYGVGAFGAGQLSGKTIYYAVRELESEFQGDGIEKPDGVTKVAEIIGNHLHGLLIKQIESEGKKVEGLPDNWKPPLGIQVSGYDGKEAKTIEVSIGKTVQFTSHEKIGVTVSGATTMVQMLFQMHNQNPQEQPIFEVFTLQDAIGYADFLISTTAAQQQFSRVIPKVGGQIDIALITPFDDFRWIKKKELTPK